MRLAYVKSPCRKRSPAKESDKKVTKKSDRSVRKSNQKVTKNEKVIELLLLRHPDRMLFQQLALALGSCAECAHTSLTLASLSTWPYAGKKSTVYTPLWHPSCVSLVPDPDRGKTAIVYAMSIKKDNREGPSYGSRRYGSAFFGPNEIWPFSLELSPSNSGKIKERTRFVKC